VNLDNPDLSITIVSWNVKSLLDDCLSSVEMAIEGLKAEIFVVDNASEDGSVEMVASRHPAVRLIANPDNRGFGRANNQALRLATGQYALILNPDTLVTGEAIRRLLAFMETHPRAALAGPEQYNERGQIKRTLSHLRLRESLEYELERLLSLVSTRTRIIFAAPRQVPLVNAACWIVRRQVMQEIGLFDESLFLYGEEPDICHRMKKAGWEIWFVRGIQIVHYHHRSIRQGGLLRDGFYATQGWLSVLAKRLILNIS
jgi:GT2 family glycosyltransferase